MKKANPLEVIVTPETPFTEQDGVEREHHVKTVKSGWGAFLKTSTSLIVLRTKMLYRNTHKTWARFLDDEFGFTDSYARKIISAAGVYNTLIATGVAKSVADTLNGEQLKQLGGVPKEKLLDILNSVGEEITTEKIKSEVEKVAPKKTSKPRKPKTVTVEIEATTVTDAEATPTAAEPPPPVPEPSPVPTLPVSWPRGLVHIELLDLDARTEFQKMPGIECCVFMDELKKDWVAHFQRVMIVRDAKYYLVPKNKESKNLHWDPAPTFNEWLKINGFGFQMHEPGQSTAPPLPTPPTPVSAPKKPLADPFAAAKQDCAKGDAALKVIGELLDWIEERQSPYTAGEALQRGSKEVIEKFKQIVVKNKIV